MMFLYPTNWVVTLASPPISLRILIEINPLRANLTKWPNTLKQFVDKLPTNCLSVFDHFVGLALKEWQIVYFHSPEIITKPQIF